MIAAIDAGKEGKAAWATSLGSSGLNLEELGNLICKALEDGSVLLAVEAPLWIPLRDKSEKMTSARDGEQKAWTSSVGACVMATGLANLSVVLQSSQPKKVVFRDSIEKGTLIIIEAYCESRGDADIAIAKLIVDSLTKNWPNKIVDHIKKRPTEKALNLAASTALALGINVDHSALQQETHVINPRII